MKYKPNWPDTRARLTALWNGAPTDRPCIACAVRTPPPQQPASPAPPQQPASIADRWVDPQWIVHRTLQTVRNTWWGGEAMPSNLVLAGWLCSLGGRPHFDDATIWFEPFAVDFDRPHPFRHDPADPWVQCYERLYLALADAAGRDDFLVGAPTILPAHDLISMHMGTTDFMVALEDHPDWMLAAITDGAHALQQARRDLVERIRPRHDFWYGNAGWMPFWAPLPYVSTQSDLSCMLSAEHFERFVMPELDLVGRQCGRVWYHLDGSDAKHHLPRLLSLPYIRVMQYVPRPVEPPNGVGHLEMYRQIQRAGRIVHVQVAPDQVEPLCRALDPRLLMLDVSFRFGSVREGEDLLASAVRWTSARA